MTEKNERNKRTLLFIGPETSSVDFDLLKKQSKNGVNTSGLIYSSSLFSSLHFCYPCSKLVTIYPIGWWPKFSKKCFIKRKTEDPNNIRASFCNVVGLRNFSIKNNLLKQIKKILFPVFKEGCQIDIVIADARTPELLVAEKIKKKYPKSTITLVVPDLPNFANTKGGVCYQFLKRFDYSLFYKHAQKTVDYYVFLSEFMKPFFKNCDQNYIISEGIVSKPEALNKARTHKRSWKIVYTGRTGEKYANIQLLIKSFEIVKNQIPETSLIIAGSGDSDQLLQKLSQKKMITFLGQITPEESTKLQEEADVLVNLRQNDPVFRYSFPSKILSYMSSGNPVVTFRLDSYPSECDQIFFYPKSENPKDVAAAIIDALTINESENDMRLRKTDNFLFERSERRTGERIFEMITKSNQKNRKNHENM